MGQGDFLSGNLPENLVARAPRGGLQALAGFFNSYFSDCKRHAPALAELATERRPCVGVRAQSVVDVHRGELVALGSLAALEEVQQDDRIDAAGQADGQTLNAPRFP